MEHKMLWGALLIGVAGWVCLAALWLLGPGAASPVPGHGAGGAGWLSLALPLVVWLGTLPTRAPWSGGQGFGRGFLLGGLLCWAGVALARAGSGRANRARLAMTTSIFGAVIAAGVPLLWMRGAVIEALLGAALGWVAVSLLETGASLLAGANAGAQEADVSEVPTPTGESATLIQSRAASSTISTADDSGLWLFNGAAFASALCGVAALGVYRDFVTPDVARGTHSALALVLAASLGLALLFDVLARQTPHSPAAARGISGVTFALCGLAPLGIGFLAATRVVEDLHLLACVGTGAALGALGWLVAWDASRRDAAPTAVSPVAVLVALCAFMLSYSLMQGFGVGLMLLAAWPVTVLVVPLAQGARPMDEGSRRMVEAEGARRRLDVAHALSLIGTCLTVLLLSRVFATRFRADLRGAGLSDQFALFGFLVGATVPVLLSSLANGADKVRASASLARLAGAGVLALAIPGAMLAVWGIKVVPAFFAGAALGLVVTPLARGKSALASGFGLAITLFLAQWTGRFLPLAELSRAQRTHFLLWGLGGALALVLVLDIGARLLARGRERTEARALPRAS